MRTSTGISNATSTRGSRGHLGGDAGEIGESGASSAASGPGKRMSGNDVGKEGRRIMKLTRTYATILVALIGLSLNSTHIYAQGRMATERPISEIYPVRIQESFKVSPDNRGVAYVAQVRSGFSSKLFVIVNGKREKQYDQIAMGTPIFSPDSQRSRTRLKPAIRPSSSWMAGRGRSTIPSLPLAEGESSLTARRVSTTWPSEVTRSTW